MMATAASIVITLFFLFSLWGEDYYAGAEEGFLLTIGASRIIGFHF
jgi:hypothetical protein